MKFGKTLRDRTLKEWRFYAVDYKELKKILKVKDSLKEQEDRQPADENSDSDLSWRNETEERNFLSMIEDSESKLSKFYHDKESWALEYMKTLRQRVVDLRECASSTEAEESSMTTPSVTSLSSDSDSESENKSGSTFDDANIHYKLLKEEYRRMGKSDHFHKYIYAKKSLTTFDRELDLIMEFLDLNKTAFSKILKKFDKRRGTSIREQEVARIEQTHKFLDGMTMKELKDETVQLIDEVNYLKPSLPEGWGSRKVYTIGCFDLFHRGHQNVLMALREFGCYIVAGVHDDESYFKLKKKYTIDNLETRMANAKPYVDQMFVIPSTDPLIYVKSMVSQQDIDSGACCYARGDDMLNFPGREWIENVMPVHFVPRTEACSSTLIRTIYHAEDKDVRAKAAFAKTRYDGKPIDEDGNVLRLSKLTV